MTFNLRNYYFKSIQNFKKWNKMCDFDPLFILHNSVRFFANYFSDKNQNCVIVEFKILNIIKNKNNIFLK